MLLFHRTRLDRAQLESVLTGGLQPAQNAWAAHALGARGGRASRRGFVFLSTSPVSGQGGDPSSFALGTPAYRVRGRSGYLIVVEVREPARPHLGGARRRATAPRPAARR